MNVEQPWIEWNGGECPVDPETRVNPKLRNDKLWENQRSSTLDWEHRNNCMPSEDIVEYQIAE